MVRPKKSSSLLRKTWSCLMMIYNDRFWWGLVKSYGLFFLAIPLACYLDGYEIMPEGAKLESGLKIT